MILSQKQSLHIEDQLTENSPEQLAALFLSHFLDVPLEEIESLEITRALSALLHRIAEETVQAIENSEAEITEITERTIH